MSGTINFLADAVNNNSVRNSLRLNDFDVVHEESQTILTDGKRRIGIQLFRKCVVCTGVIQNLQASRLVGVKLVAKNVDKGVYLLGFCGNTHFLPHFRLEPNNGVVRNNIRGVAGLTIDTGVIGGPAGVSVADSRRDGAQLLSSHGHCGGRVVGNSGCSNRSSFSFDESQTGDQRAQRNTVDSGHNGFSGVTAVSGLSGCGFVPDSDVRARTEESWVDKCRRKLGVTPGDVYRPEKKKRESKLQGKRSFPALRHAQRFVRKKDESLGDVWCRHCRDKDERCSNCEILLKSRVATSIAKDVTVEARRVLKQIGNVVQSKGGYEKMPEVHTRGLHEVISQLRVNTDLNQEDNAKRNSQFSSDLSCVSVAEFNVKKNDVIESTITSDIRRAHTANSTTKLAAKMTAASQIQDSYRDIEYQRLKESVSGLTEARRLALLNKTDKKNVIRMNADLVYSEFDKLKHSQQMEVASRLSARSLRELLSEKEEDNNLS